MNNWEVSKHQEWDLMYLAGLTAREIADRCQSNLSTVHMHFRKREEYQPGFRRKHLEALAARHKDRPSVQWKTRFRELQNFVATEGRLPTHKGPLLEKSLSQWLTKQRTSYSREQMSPSKISLLNEIDGWNRSNRHKELEEKWECNLIQLCNYVEINGKFPKYHNFSSEIERKLGVWLHIQHQRRNEGRIRISRLQALNKELPGWRSYS